MAFQSPSLHLLDFTYSPILLSQCPLNLWSCGINALHRAEIPPHPPITYSQHLGWSWIWAHYHSLQKKIIWLWLRVASVCEYKQILKIPHLGLWPPLTWIDNRIHSTGIEFPPIKRHSNPIRGQLVITVVSQLHIRSHVASHMIILFCKINIWVRPMMCPLNPSNLNITSWHSNS